jgi:hypothetical protein
LRGASAPDAGDQRVPLAVERADGAWSGVPRASLYDDHGKLIISHLRGPTWQATDGSQAVGTVVKHVNLDQTVIDWVLLSTTTTPRARQ